MPAGPAAFASHPGAVDSVDPAHARLIVLGQDVMVTGSTTVDDSTVYDGALQTLQPGDTVAVSDVPTSDSTVVRTCGIPANPSRSCRTTRSAA